MDCEEAIYEDFANGDLKYLDAIQRLQGIGYDPKEAERVVSEWADALDEGPDPMRDVDFPFAENH